MAQRWQKATHGLGVSQPLRVPTKLCRRYQFKLYKLVIYLKCQTVPLKADRKFSCVFMEVWSHHFSVITKALRYFQYGSAVVAVLQQSNTALQYSKIKHE